MWLHSARAQRFLQPQPPALPNPLRWNERTVLRLVRLDHEESAAARAVRLSSAHARRGDPIRVVLSGVELEGRIMAIVGASLEIALGAPRTVKAKMAKLSARAIERPRSKRRAS